jgi:hypothetical protein
MKQPLKPYIHRLGEGSYHSATITLHGIPHKGPLFSLRDKITIYCTTFIGKINQ